MKTVKLLVVGAMLSLTTASCGKNIDKDAEKIAGLMCESENGLIKDLEMLQQIETLEKAYNEQEKRQLEKLIDEKYMAKCGKEKLEESNDFNQ